MAFPSVRSVNSSAVAGQTGITVPMPASIVAGDLLLLFIRMNTNAKITSAPTGFTSLTFRELNNEVTYLYAKVAAGGDAATFNTDAINGYGMVCAAIQSWEGTLTGVETTAIAASSNPLLLAPSWGSVDNLFIVGAAARAGTLPAVSAWSTNYTQVAQVTGDFGTDVVAGLASRQLAAASDDPGFVNFSGSALNATVVTIAVRPSAGVFDPANLDASVTGDDVTLTWDV